MKFRELIGYGLSRLCLAIALGALGLAWSRIPEAGPRLIIPLAYSVPGVAQVFFDTGSGFNARDVVTVEVPRSGVLREVVFPLPGVACRGLRFDPFSSEGAFQIGVPRYESASGRILHRFALQELQIGQQLKESAPTPGWRTFSTTAGANDPILLLSVREFLDPGTAEWPWGEVAFAALFFGCYLATLRRWLEVDSRIITWFGHRLRLCSGAFPLGLLASMGVQFFVLWPLHRVLDLPTYDEVNYAARGAAWVPLRGDLGQFHNSPLYAMSYAVWHRITGDLGSAIFLQHYVLKLGLAAVGYLLIVRWWRSPVAAFSLVAIFACASYNIEQPYLVYHAALLVFGVALLLVSRWPLAGMAFAFLSGCIRQEYLIPAVLFAIAVGVLLWRGRMKGDQLLALAREERWVGATVLVVALLVVGLVVSCTRIGGSSDRMWYAFQQHFAFRAMQRGETAPPFSPWVDYDVVIRRDFGGAGSVGEAVRANPAAFFRHLRGNMADAPAELASVIRPAPQVARKAIWAWVLAAVLAVVVAARPNPAVTRTLDRGLAILAILAVAPSLVVSARDSYLLPLIPFSLVAVGWLVSAIPSSRAASAQRWPTSLAALAAMVGLGFLINAEPIMAEGSSDRRVVDTVAFLDRLWDDSKVRILYGVEATSFAHYLGAKKCQGIEAMETAYGRQQLNFQLAAEIARHGVDAVLVTDQWRASSRFDREGVERLKNDPSWVRHLVPAGELFVRSLGETRVR